MNIEKTLEEVNRKIKKKSSYFVDRIPVGS